MESCRSTFDQNYQTHLKHLKLKGLQPKTIEAYARAIRRHRRALRSTRLTICPSSS